MHAERTEEFSEECTPRATPSGRPSIILAHNAVEEGHEECGNFRRKSPRLEKASGMSLEQLPRDVFRPLLARMAPRDILNLAGTCHRMRATCTEFVAEGVSGSSRGEMVVNALGIASTVRLWRLFALIQPAALACDLRESLSGVGDSKPQLRRVSTARQLLAAIHDCSSAILLEDGEYNLEGEGNIDLVGVELCGASTNATIRGGITLWHSILTGVRVDGVVRTGEGDVALLDRVTVRSSGRDDGDGFHPGVLVGKGGWSVLFRCELLVAGCGGTLVGEGATCAEATRGGRMELHECSLQHNCTSKSCRSVGARVEGSRMELWRCRVRGHFCGLHAFGGTFEVQGGEVDGWDMAVSVREGAAAALRQLSMEGGDAGVHCEGRVDVSCSRIASFRSAGLLCLSCGCATVGRCELTGNGIGVEIGGGSKALLSDTSLVGNGAGLYVWGNGTGQLEGGKVTLSTGAGIQAEGSGRCRAESSVIAFNHSCVLRRGCAKIGFSASLPCRLSCRFDGCRTCS